MTYLSERGTAATSKVHINPDGTFELSDPVDSRTWPGSINDPGRRYVLLDFMAPFERKDEAGDTYTVSDADSLQRFYAGLLDKGLIPLPYGSNGYNHMLLARGGASVVGAVMLAQGGTWDAIGAEVAVAAGAGRRALKIIPGENPEERRPGDPSAWDLLILGNDESAADVLTGIAKEAYARRERVSPHLGYLADLR